MGTSGNRSVWGAVLAVGTTVGTLGCSSADSSSGSVAEWCALNDEQLGGEIVVELGRLFQYDERTAAAGAAGLSEILDEAGEAAPDDIAEDVAIVVATADAAIEAFSDARYRLLDVEIDGFRDLTSGRTVAADAAISEFTLDNCKSGSFLDHFTFVGRGFADAADGSTFGSLIEDALREMRLTETEIACVLDGLDGGETLTPPSPLFAECGVGPDRLAGLTPSTDSRPGPGGLFGD